MTRSIVFLLLLATASSAAPVPKENGPDPKLVVGSWHWVYAESDKEALTMWGSATITLHADGKALATFGRGPDPKAGLFADATGTWTLSGRALTLKLARGKDEPETVTAILQEVTKTRVRFTFPDDDRKRVTVMERVKSKEDIEAKKK